MSGSEAVKSEQAASSAQNDLPRQAKRPLAFRGARGVTRGRLTLLCWFALAFVASYGLVVGFGALLVKSDKAQVVERDDSAQDGLFPDSLLVNNPGVALRVSHHPRLNPSADDDFLLYLWFKIRKPIPDGERLSLLGKFDVSLSNRPGYALALVGEPDGVRPNVYWQNDDGQGRWYPFASSQIKAKEWYFIAVSFREGRYLGVHLMSTPAAKKPEVLGGYDLQPPIIPGSQVDLIVGAFGASKFRGRLGAFGIIRREGLSEDLPGLISELARSAGEIPRSLSASEIVFAASPKTDKGPLGLAIQPIVAGGASRSRDDATKGRAE